MFKKEEEKKPKEKAAVKSVAKEAKPKTKKEKTTKDNISIEKNDKKSSGKDIFIKLVTEKTTDLSENGAYSFKVEPGFNKIMVKNEIKRLYGVAPIKINIINSPYKKVSYRGRPSKKPGFKKAIVYLKPGDKLPE